MYVIYPVYWVCSIKDRCVRGGKPVMRYELLGKQDMEYAV